MPRTVGCERCPNVPGLTRPTRKSWSHAEKVLMTVNAIEMRRDKGVKTR